MGRPSEFLLRFAADRWVAGGRPDLYDEWSAELAELRAEGGLSPLRRMAFAASLAASRVPRAGSVSASERLSGIGWVAGPTVILLVVPSVGLMVGSVLLLFPDLLSPRPVLSNPMLYVTGGLKLLVLVALAVVLALAGRALGRRLPLSLVSGTTYRTTVLAVLTPVVLVIGMIPVLGLSSHSAGPAELVAGLAVWVVLTAVTVPVVLRPLRSGRRWLARLWMLLAALLALDVAVVLVALPRMLPAPGALRSIPFWLPDLLLDGFGRVPMGPDYHGIPLAIVLAMAVTPLHLLLFCAAAFGLPYALAAVRSPVTAGRPAPARVEPAAGGTAEVERGWPEVGVARHRRLDWVLAGLGGAAWLGLVVWLTPLADRLTAAGRGTDELVSDVLELRKVAVLMVAGGLVVALRRAGPGWPAVLSVPVLLAVDTLLARGRPATGVAVTVVLVALVLVAVAAGVAARLVGRPDREYGRWTVPVVGVVAGCVAAAPAALGDVARYSRPVLVPVVVVLGAMLGALAARCVVLVRAPRAGRAARVGFTLLGAVPFGAGGLLTALRGGWFELPGGLGAFAAVLVVVLMWRGHPLLYVPRAGLALAMLLCTPLFADVAIYLAVVVDSVVPARPGLTNTVAPTISGAALPTVTGTLLVGVALAAVLVPLIRHKRLIEVFRGIRLGAVVVTVAAVLGALSGIALGSWLSWRDVDRLAPSPAASSAIARAVLPVRADGPRYYGRHTFWNPYSEHTLHGGTGVRIGTAVFSADAPRTSYRALEASVARRLRAQGYHQVHIADGRDDGVRATVVGTHDGYQVEADIYPGSLSDPRDPAGVSLTVMWAAPTSQLAWTVAGGLAGVLVGAVLALWTLRRVRGRSKPFRWTYIVLCAVTLLMLFPACFGNIPTEYGAQMSVTDREFNSPSVYWGGFVIYGAEPLAMLSVIPLLAILILCAWPRRRPTPTPVARRPDPVDRSTTVPLTGWFGLRGRRGSGHPGSLPGTTVR